jgi:hypothetical protein
VKIPSRIISYKYCSVQRHMVVSPLAECVSVLMQKLHPKVCTLPTANSVSIN